MSKEKPSYTFNFNTAVDKAEETKTFAELSDRPPSALQGLTEKGDLVFAKYNIHTIKDLATWKYYHIAKAIFILSTTEDGSRAANAHSNFNDTIVEGWRSKTLAELVDAPLTALSGIGDKIATDFKGLRPAPKTIGELANWKYTKWAESLVTLSLYETADHSSR